MTPTRFSAERGILVNLCFRESRKLRNNVRAYFRRLVLFGRAADWVRCETAAPPMIAVGTLIAERPPHRSRRALLTHRAPPSGRTSSDARREAACDPAHSRQSGR